MAHKFQLVLKEKVKLAEGTEHFAFTVDYPEHIEYKAGQFISLHIMSEGKEHRRNYSIANSPNKQNDIELAMAYLPNGLASTVLSNLKPGETVQASGPYGQFILKDEILPQRYILIGTGTGITPYRSMLPDLGALLDNSELKVVILQGVRTRADLLYADEFINFAAQYPNASFKACYSRERLTEALDFELAGYVQDHLEELQVRHSSDIAYLCGNPNMVDATFQKLQDLGVDRAHIRREKYISSK
jgi:ferredoxin-NADP reductase